MVKAVFPGTFDPPTNGHLDMITRISKLFDSVNVVIAINNMKDPLLPAKIRQDLLIEQLSPIKGRQINVDIWDGLIVDYCHTVGAKVILRGIRSCTELDRELKLAILNKQLDTEIETLMLPCDPHFLAHSSSAVKELLYFGSNISHLVPPEVATALHATKKDPESSIA